MYNHAWPRIHVQHSATASVYDFTHHTVCSLGLENLLVN